MQKPFGSTSNVPLFHIHLMDVSECCGMPEEALREADAVLHLPVVSTYQAQCDRILFQAHLVSHCYVAGTRQVTVDPRPQRRSKAGFTIRPCATIHGALTYAGRAAFLLEQMQAPLPGRGSGRSRDVAGRGRQYLDSHGWPRGSTLPKN